jgi:hypothetical protein
MSIDEVEHAYIDLSRQAFKSSRHRLNLVGRLIDLLGVQGRFNSKALEEAVKQTISKSGHDPDCKLLDEIEEQAHDSSKDEAKQQACKVYVAIQLYLCMTEHIPSFVCTVHQGNASLAILSNYKSPDTFEDQPEGITVWEAARATSAATSFFAPIEIGKLKMGYVDGGLVSNNPIHTVWNQARHWWPPEEFETFLLSIGTGEASRPSLKGGLSKIVKSLVQLATETERTADEFSEEHHDIIEEDLFFRFNVTQGLETIQLDEVKHMNSIVEATSAYLNRPMIANTMTRCVRKMKEMTQCMVSLSTFSIGAVDAILLRIYANCRIL